MLRPKACLAVAVLAVASLLSVPVQAGDAIKMVPADALALVVVDGLKVLDAKVGKALESLQLPLPGLLTSMEAVPGLPDCLDQESQIVVAVFRGVEAGDDPVPVAFVPVEDFDAFTKLLGGEEDGDFVRLTVATPPRLAVEKDGFAVVAREDNKQILTRVLKSSGGIAEKLGDDLAWIDERDIAAVMTDGGISVLCAKIQEGIDVAQVTLREQGKDAIGAAEILNVYRRGFAVVDQEVELVGVGLDVRESGDLALQIRKRFLPAGQFAQCLAISSPAADLLAGLPAEPFVIAGGCRFTPAMGRLLMDYSVEMMRAAPKLYGISNEQGDRMLELAGPLMAKMESLAMMLAVGSPDNTVYSRMAGVMRSEDSEEYLESYEKYLRQFSEVMKDSKGIFSMAIESSPIEIDGCRGVEIAMELPEDLVAGAGEANAVLEKMVGPGGKIRLFVVAADKHHVLFGYTNKRLLRKAIVALREGKSISEEASVQQASEKLTPGNFGQGYFSPTGFVAFLNDMMKAVVPEEQRIEIPAFPATPPVAWTANAEGAVVDAQIVVPSDMIKVGIVYAGQVRQLMPPRGE